MSDLTRFRDHCRRMTTAEHHDRCPGRDPARPAYLKPDPSRCQGCVSDADRALWVRLADEADRYLGHRNPDAADGRENGD